MAVRRPRATLAVALLLAAAAAALAAARLELRTSNLDLIDPDLPEVARFRGFAEAFGSPNLLVAVLEGEDPVELSRAADRLGSAVAGSPGLRSVVARLPFRDEILVPLGVDPYFRSRDGRLLFVFFQPDDPRSAAATIGPFVAGVRERTAALGLEAVGITVGFTGLPQYALDDRDFVRHDVARLSGLSLVLVAAIFVVGFRGLREPLLSIGALLVAALWTAGVAALVPGHLTLISAFFFSILFGLGIDSGVHLVERAADYRAQGDAPAVALERSVRFLAPGLGTAAATTSASFFLLLASGFRGFAELGWLAGVGVLLALFSMVTVLPAALVLLPGSGKGRSVERSRAGRVLLTLGRPWLAAPLVAAPLALLWTGVPRFDGNYLDLEPRGSEAVRVEREMVARSDFAPQFAAFVVEDDEQAGALAERLAAEPTVGEVRSIAQLEPLVALEAQVPGAWESFRSLYVDSAGRRAVYAFPHEDAWEPEFQARFLAAMRAIDPEVTGMPFVGRFLIDRSWRALRITAALAAVALLLIVAVDLARPVRVALALLPTFVGVALMLVAMRALGVAFNPLDVLALPVVLGIAEDSGVHLVHRFLAERGDLARTLSGAGRTILICGATTLAGFGALALASHRGLASFAMVTVLGVGASLALSLVVLPQLLRRFAHRVLGPAGAPEPSR